MFWEYVVTGNALKFCTWTTLAYWGYSSVVASSIFANAGIAWMGAGLIFGYWYFNLSSDCKSTGVTTCNGAA